MYLRRQSLGAPVLCLLHLALHDFIFTVVNEQTINIIKSFAFSPPD